MKYFKVIGIKKNFKEFQQKIEKAVFLLRISKWKINFYKEICQGH